MEHLIGELVQHESLGIGVFIQIQSDGKGVFQFRMHEIACVLDSPFIKWTGLFSKTRRSVSRTGDFARPTLSLSSEKRARLAEIFKADDGFHMPISAPPDKEDDVKDEFTNADNGLTIASTLKLQTSYDTVFSTNPEVDTLLDGSGAYTRPFFGSPVVSLLHGPRKAFFIMLIDLGFQPSRLAAI